MTRNYLPDSRAEWRMIARLLGILALLGTMMLVMSVIGVRASKQWGNVRRHI